MNEASPKLGLGGTEIAEETASHGAAEERRRSDPFAPVGLLRTPTPSNLFSVRLRSFVPPCYIVTSVASVILGSHYSRRPNTHSDSPEIAVTYCLPSTSYEIGPLTICAPRLAFHRSVPLRASIAWKYPSRPPVNSTSDAVVRMPLSLTSVMSNFHFWVPVSGSTAITAPLATASVQVLIGPRLSTGTAGAFGTGPYERLLPPPKLSPS